MLTGGISKLGLITVASLEVLFVLQWNGWGAQLQGSTRLLINRKTHKSHL